MELANTLTQVIQIIMKFFIVLMLIVTVIIPLFIFNKAKKRKEENLNNLQDATFDMPKENNPITESERKTLIGMATLIKIILGIITIIILIYPIIVLWAALGR